MWPLLRRGGVFVNCAESQEASTSQSEVPVWKVWQKRKQGKGNKLTSRGGKCWVREELLLSYFKKLESENKSVLKIKNVPVILSNLVYGVLWTGQVEAGEDKSITTKKSILTSLLIWIIYLRNQLSMERENAVAVEGGSKCQVLLSFHVGENVRVWLKLRTGGWEEGGE